MKELFRKIRSSLTSFLEAKETRQTASAAAGAVVIVSMIFTALLFSSSASALEEERRLERTGEESLRVTPARERRD